MDKILITGGTGLVGQAIVKQCHDKGISINYLTTDKTKIKSLPNYQGFHWNPPSNDIDIDCFKEVDAIINLAGASIAKRWTPKWKQQMIDSRLKSLQLLYDAIKLHNIKIEQLISASAIGYYPDSLTNFYDESYVSIPGTFVSRLVKDWEDAVDCFKDLHTKVAKLRIGVVLSQNGGALPKMATPIKWFIGAPFGSGKQWQSWIHIEDLTNLFLYVFKYKLEGVYNAVAPNPVTHNYLTKAIAKTVNRPIFLPRIPSFVLKRLLGEMSQIVLEGQRVSSKRIENLGFEFKHPTIEAALQDLF